MFFRRYFKYFEYGLNYWLVKAMFSKRARRDWVLITLRPLTSGLKDISDGNSLIACDIMTLFCVVIKFPQFLQFPLLVDCGKMFLMSSWHVKQTVG